MIEPNQFLFDMIRCLSIKVLSSSSAYFFAVQLLTITVFSLFSLRCTNKFSFAHTNIKMKQYKMKIYYFFPSLSVIIPGLSINQLHNLLMSMDFFKKQCHLTKVIDESIYSSVSDIITMNMDTLARNINTDSVYKYNIPTYENTNSNYMSNPTAIIQDAAKFFAYNDGLMALIKLVEFEEKGKLYGQNSLSQISEMMPIDSAVVELINLYKFGAINTLLLVSPQPLSNISVHNIIDFNDLIMPGLKKGRDYFQSGASPCFTLSFDSDEMADIENNFLIVISNCYNTPQFLQEDSLCNKFLHTRDDLEITICAQQNFGFDDAMINIEEMEQNSDWRHDENEKFGHYG